MANVPLADGLNACRLRYDGRLIDIQGNVTACRASDQPLIYLNTRVGWPTLSSGVRAGAVIIDRTSFASGEIFDRALAWAERHQAGTVIVLADVGDEMTARAVEASGRRFIAWPWIAPLVDHVGWELGRPTSTSPLSTNSLLHQANEGPQAIVFTAPAVDELFRSAIAGMARARRIDASLPRSLVVARRLLNGLSQCCGSINNYNQWAALDHRSTTLSSLRRELEDSRGTRLGGVWSTFAETRWASLRLDLLELYELLCRENPKLFTLAFAVGHLRGERPNAKLIIRVANEAAGHALREDLIDLLPEHAPDGTKVCGLPWSDRLPWATEPIVELHPAMPPPSRLATLWTGESTSQLLVLYPFEVQSARRALDASRRQHDQDLIAACAACDLGVGPHLPAGSHLPIAYSFSEVDRRVGQGHPPIDIGVDVQVLFEDLAEEPGQRAGPPGAGLGAVKARPLVLEPSGEWWWVREGSTVETLVANRLVYRPLDEIRPGMVVVVPRGEGREELFARAVVAAHARGDIRAFEVLFGRWREACWTVYRACGENWRAVESRMRAEDARVTWQSFRAWAIGTTIAPDDPQDIARIGRVAGDRLVEQEYRRLYAMADEVRLLHGRLGRLLSAAIMEALAGGGPSLDALAELLGGLDPTELLEEFELRSVHGVGQLDIIPASDLRKVVPPRP
jgi:hypothetical protein